MKRSEICWLKMDNIVACSSVIKLQDIINSRKSERKKLAEDVRLKDLQRIRDMKSTSGIDPLDQFPKEIWEKIFVDLDPKDKANFWQMHPQFREILNENRIRDILLPQALMVREFQHALRNPKNIESLNCMETYFGDDLGRLRCISKSTRIAVDQWVKNAIRNDLDRQDEYSDDNDAYPLLSYDKDDLLKKMLVSFGGSNPAKLFFPKGLLVCLPTWGGQINDLEIQEHLRASEALIQYKNQITKLLEIIGDQIWQFQLLIGSSGGGLEFEWRRNDVNLTNSYTLFQHWAHCMPNLKLIRLKIGSLPEKPLSFSPTAAGENPFPYLPALERVRFEFEEHPQFWQRHGSMLNRTLWIHKAVLDANTHLKSLDLLYANGPTLALLPAHLIKTLPLTNLTVHQNYEDDEDHVPLSFQQIQPMINYEWQLKSIQLCLWEENIPLCSILRFLERFPTLEFVTLKLGKEVRIGYFGDTFGYLQLPNLTYLNLKMTKPEIDFGNGSNVESFFSLQFLLNCKKLKWLLWSLRGFDDEKLRDYLQNLERQGKMIEFRAGMRVLYESNVWDAFPCLEVVYVENWKLKNHSSTSLSGNPCIHVYIRKDIAEGKSVNRFLELHSCFRSEKSQNCVLLKP